ncbi:MAG TPA: 3-hydroxyacyl-CoA dehydrogenase NAD-binding domain-containing protein [Euzebyales bacterium]|nr:3-hydroxyacyl-CoA dehydrogenase NAD-binding domain-containing protein [Euzebyales bacterium]
MTDRVTADRHGAVAVITIDNPPLNVFSPSVPEGIAAHVRDAEADDGVRAIVITGAGSHFVAGADITTFGMPRDEAPDLPGLIHTLAEASKPVVAAIRGTAFGGGLEMAMACHWRIATPDANLGLPEVKLGLLPGAGGTQRLPRLVGLTTALRMITTGSPVDGRRAHELGLVDALAEDDVVATAVAFTQRMTSEDDPLRRTHELEVAVDGDAREIVDGARAEAERRAPGLIAPQRCIDAVAAAVELPFGEGVRRERELFEELMESDQSRSLRHVFFAERRAAKIDDIGDDVEPRTIRQGAVIGAGTMGGGIAMNFANAGIPVTVVEVDRDSLDRGLARVEGNYQRTVDKGRLEPDEKRRRLDRIAGTTDFEGVADADVVIEAVFEDMDLKREVFGRLDGTAADHAVLATNTSTLDVNEIARATNRPASVVGMHFFSPANVMRLLEVVRGEATSDEALLTAVTLGKKMGKVPVVVGVCDGFVGNRMFHVYVDEATALIEEGALPQDVDRVMTDFGFKMGPFAVQDLAGLDVGYRIRNQQAVARGINPDARERTIADTIVERDRLGQKTGAGFYRYDEGSRTPVPDPEIEELIVAHAKEHDIERRDIDDQEIRDRLLGQLINEGARILEEGIAQRASDIDVIYVHGYGFPAHRGGPMFHAGLVGLDEVLATTDRLHQRHGHRWEPAPLLRELAMDGRTFADA